MPKLNVSATNHGKRSAYLEGGELHLLQVHSGGSSVLTTVKSSQDPQWATLGERMRRGLADPDADGSDTTSSSIFCLSKQTIDQSRRSQLTIPPLCKEALASI